MCLVLSKSAVFGKDGNGGRLEIHTILHDDHDIRGRRIGQRIRERKAGSERQHRAEIGRQSGGGVERGHRRRSLGLIGEPNQRTGLLRYFIRGNQRGFQNARDNSRRNDGSYIANRRFAVLRGEHDRGVVQEALFP